MNTNQAPFYPKKFPPLPDPFFLTPPRFCLNNPNQILPKKFAEPHFIKFRPNWTFKQTVNHVPIFQHLHIPKHPIQNKNQNYQFNGFTRVTQSSSIHDSPNFVRISSKTTSDSQQVFEETKRNELFRISSLQFKTTQEPHSSIEPESSELKSTNKIFKRLKKFLLIVFSYSPIMRHDLQTLKSSEKLILVHILESKKYDRSRLLVQNIKSNDFSFDAWNQFFKLRRKEENLKYSFKLIIKYLQNQFVLSNQKLINNFSEENKKLLFYLFYFYEVESQKSFNCLLQEICSKKEMLWNKCLGKYWKTIDKYILPEMGTQSSYSKVKSISKDFMISFVKPDKISRLFTECLIKITLNLCYAIKANSKTSEMLESETKMDKLGKEILQIIHKTNFIEINKLFSEWDNKITSENSTKKDNQKISLKFYVDIIKKGIKRKNFKFPWTFREVQNSFIESLFSYLEILKYHQIVKNNSGIY